MKKNSPVHKWDNPESLAKTRRNVGLHQRAQTTPSRPSRSPEPSEPSEDGMPSWSTILAVVTTLTVCLTVGAIAAAAAQRPRGKPGLFPDTCPAPDLKLDRLNVTGIPVLFENVVRGIETSAREILPCIDQLPGMNTTFKKTPKTRVPVPHSRSTGRGGSRLPSRALTVDEIARIKACQRAMVEGREAPELATHVVYFGTSGKPCPASRIIDVHEATPSERDAELCFSHRSIESRLTQLRPDESNSSTGWLVWLFNFLNGGLTSCPHVRELEKTEHAGGLRLFSDRKQYDRERRQLILAGKFDSEQFENLLGFARQVQGTDEVFLADTLTQFAEILDQSFPPERGSARDTSSWIPFWGSIKKWAQTQAAAASRSQLIEASYPTAKPLMATYVTVEDGQEVTKTAPCIQSSMLRLFLENTPLYFATAKDAIASASNPSESLAASSVSPSDETNPGLRI